MKLLLPSLACLVLGFSACKRNCTKDDVYLEVNAYQASFAPYIEGQQRNFVDSAGHVYTMNIEYSGVTGSVYVGDHGELYCPKTTQRIQQVNFSFDSTSLHGSIKVFKTISNDDTHFQVQIDGRVMIMTLGESAATPPTNAIHHSLINLQGIDYDQVEEVSSYVPVENKYSTIWIRPGLDILRFAKPNGAYLELTP